MLENVPSFMDSGMTLTFWYRHIDCTSGDICGVYLLWSDGKGGAGASAGCDQQGIWSLWLETDGIWVDNVKGSPKYQYPRNFMPIRTKWKGSEAWRFVSFTLDENSNQALLYMDGRLAVSVPWGSDVRRADCPMRSVALGHSTPGWTYGAEVGKSNIHRLLQFGKSNSTPAPHRAPPAGTLRMCVSALHPGQTLP